MDIRQAVAQDFDSVKNTQGCDTPSNQKSHEVNKDAPEAIADILKL